MKLVPALIAASMLAACAGGGGTSSLPNSNTPDAHSSSTGDFTVMGAYRAIGDANREIHFLPSNDGLWRTMSHGAQGHGSAGTAGNLLYNGGPIQNSPKTYVVYWGSAWSTTGDPNGMRNYYNAFLGKVGGSSWNSTVTQYYQTNPTLYTGNVANNFGGSYIDTTSSPPRNPSQSAMAAEAAKAAAHFGNYGVNAQYIVAMPHGIVPSGFKTQYCAYHSTTSAGGGTISWTNMPYLPDAGASCGAGSVTGSSLDGVSIVGGHEMAESETDPYLNAWYDSGGSEIGDKCAWVNLQDTNLNGTNYPTQPLWSNSANGCVQ